MLTISSKFAEYGHNCQLPFVPDDLYMFSKEGNRFVRLKNFFIRIRMASDLHVAGRKTLNSHFALYLELQKHLGHLHIIHPFSPFRMWWDFLMTFVYLLQFIVIPVEVAIYDSQLGLEEKILWFILRLTLDATCLVDVALNFFSGYCDSSTKDVVMRPKRIALHYLRTYCVFDVVSSILAHSELLVSGSLLAHGLKCFSLLKFLRIFTFFSHWHALLEYCDVSYMKYNVSKLVCSFLLFVHVVTCINIFMGSKGVQFGDKEYYWRTVDLIKNLRLYEYYILNVYKALQLVSLSGFGVTPINSLLKIYVLVTWILSKLVYIFLIASILKLVITTRSANMKYIEKERTLKEYMKYKKLPEYLQKRLLGLYEYRYQHCFFRESEILKNISGHLRQDIELHSCQKLVENVDFLKDLPMAALVKIVGFLKNEIFFANDVVFRVFTPGFCMYFIATGSVSVYTPQGREICHLRDGSYFGEIAMLIPRTKRVASIVAVEISEVYRLDRKDFMIAIMPYPRLVAKLRAIAEKRVEATELFVKRNE